MKRVWVISAVIVVLSLAFYYLLGGFASVDTELAQSKGYQLQGKMFEGKYNAKALEELFYEIKSHAADADAQFVIVNFNEFLNEETGSIKQFVGLVSDQPILSLESHSIAAGEYTRATITAHNFVMPKPAAIRISLQNLTDKPLEPFSIEIYSGESLIIEIPLKTN